MDGIPLIDDDEAFLDEVPVSLLDGSDGSDDEQDIGGINEQVEHDEPGGHDNTAAYDLGDTFIILTVEEHIFLGKITDMTDNSLSMEGDDEKRYTFEYADNEIIMKTDTYEIIDMIRVKLYVPEDEVTEYVELEFDTEELLEKNFSDLAIKDDLLSSMIQSMDIYDKPQKILLVQKRLDVILELINTKEVVEDYKIPCWLIPIIEDDLKLYDSLGLTLEQELIEEFRGKNDIRNYKDFLTNSLSHSKPIETKTGYGLETNEYSGNYLRNCLQEDTCAGVLGSYAYDERINSPAIKLGDEIVLPANKLRMIGLLEEPINKHVYSATIKTLENFTMFESYMYADMCKKQNLNKSDRMKNTLMLVSTDNSEVRENSKFIIHNLPQNSKLTDVKEYINNCHVELTNLLLSDDKINDSLYNYNDIEKLLFKYNLCYSDLKLSEREKIDELLSSNIKRYKKEYILYSKKLPDSDVVVKKVTLTDEKRVILSRDIIFAMNKKKDRNYYLQRYIDLFSRSAENETESPNNLYNKFTNEVLLCKHYLYEINITDTNDMFSTMKSKFGDSPSDGCISCKFCGCYLCHEDSGGDGFDGDVPVQLGAVMEVESLVDVSEYIKGKEEPSKIIKDIGASIGATLEDKDIYEILMSYSLLDHETLADMRYGLKDVSYTDIHPRVNTEIQKIKVLEKKEKDKMLKKELKEKRENIITNFQRWLKDTNKVLMLSTLTMLYIQTMINQIHNTKTSFVLLDIKNKSINSNALQYLSAKIRRISDKYSGEKIWKSALSLFNEKEYGTNEIVKQLELTTKYCMEPTFPRIIERITYFENHLEAMKNNYLKQEWVTFKPLVGNTLVKNITGILRDNEDQNIPNLRKVYGGVTVENNSIVRPISQSYMTSVASVLKIPELEILKNQCFKVLFRYTVSLYGKHPDNIFITLTCQRLLETTTRKTELLAVFNKSGWHGSSFTKLDFKTLRTKLIPDIFGLYGSNVSINSCYSNEKSCNHFIHNAINTYDLPLLNTRPKRIYEYKAPNVYPKLSYGRLKETVRHDEEGNVIKNVIEKVFDTYKYDEMGDIVRVFVDDFYLQFYARSAIMDVDVLTMNKFQKIEQNENNFLTILTTINKRNSLFSNKESCKRKFKYDEDDYEKVKSYSKLDGRFHGYLGRLSNLELSDNRSKVVTDLLTIFDEIMVNGKKDLGPILKKQFATIISETENNIAIISKHLAQSDNITVKQKKRFSSVFKEHNPGRILNFNSETISSIVTLFIMDPNLTYSHLTTYTTDIRNIISRLTHKNDMRTKLPKEWKCTDTIDKQFTDFLDRDGNSVYLYLHNNIFVKSKDNYTGFNSYINDDEDNVNYFKLLSGNIQSYFDNIDMIKGTSNSEYLETYSTIYMKYHFTGIFVEIVNTINDLKSGQSDITRDSNDLFNSLEERDENLIEDMIDVLSQFMMDLLTHVLFQHYDPTWLFLNEQKLDLSNRLSKQKEREKQILVDKLDAASVEERFAMMQKQQMGISLFYKQGAENAEKYVKSDEYSNHTSDERVERFKELAAASNVELDFLRSEEDGSVEEVAPPAYVQEAEEGYVDYAEMDEDEEDYMDDYLDEEQEQSFNE